MSDAPVALRSQEWEAQIRPAIGGVISALRFRGADILQPMPETSTNPLESGCFPLVPFCNRIGNARFIWQGDECELPQNCPPEQHALHGFGWQSAWSVLTRSDDEVLLQHIHTGDKGWHWPYRAQMRIRVTPTGCMIGLILTNFSSIPMPAGLGLHPYFLRSTDTRMQFAAGGIIETGADSLPTGKVLPADSFGDWYAGTRIPDSLIDHCYRELQGEIRIRTDHGEFLVGANGAPHLHLYAPPGEDYFCLEPVSHTPDAVNQHGQPMTLLAPGNSAFLSMRIRNA